MASIGNDRYVLIRAPSTAIAEEKEVKENTGKSEEPLSLTLMLKKGNLSMRGSARRFTVDLVRGVFNTVNSANGKYAWALVPGSADPFTMTQIVNAAGWTQLSALFDEFFIESCTMTQEPLNQFSSLYVSGGSGANLSTEMAVVVGLQHSLTIGDSGTAFQTAALEPEHKVVNSARPFKFRWRNLEKFAWDGPLGDQSTTTSTQSWCTVANSGKYGGLISAFFPSISAAAATPTAFLTSQTIGTAIYRFKVHFRLRT